MRNSPGTSTAIAFAALLLGVASCGDDRSSSDTSAMPPIVVGDEIPAGDDASVDVPTEGDGPDVPRVDGDGETGGNGETGGESDAPIADEPPPTAADDVDALVAEVRAAYGVPALGGAVVTADGVVAFGVAGERRAGGPAVTDEDRWHIGSNLKAITAFLAGIAVEDGIIGWERTVADAFPELAVADAYRDVTLRELLTHRSGLPRNAFEAPVSATDARGQRDEVAAWAFAQPPAAPRGTYHYSNLGYAMAGAMLERAYGSTYEDVIDTGLFAPIGVRRHGWGPQAAPGASDAPVPHSYHDGDWIPCEGCDNPPWLSAAGRMHLPLGEWALVVREMLRADDGRSTLVSADTGRLLFGGEIALDGTADEYGYGWIVTNAADRESGLSYAALDALVSRLLARHDGDAGGG